MTVYVSQQPILNRHNWMPNLEPATKYGQLKYIFQGDAQPYQTPQRSLAHAIDILQDFKPKQDHLLWPNTGDPTAMWCAILAFQVLGIDCVSFLYWNKPRGNSQGYYAPIEFNLKEMLNGTKRDSGPSHPS